MDFINSKRLSQQDILQSLESVSIQDKENDIDIAARLNFIDSDDDRQLPDHDDALQDDLRDSAMDEEEIKELPAHSCQYCQIHNPSSVVKCLGCNKWFCNARISTSASHIVHHLVRQRHKEVQLHPESALGDIIPECYNCGCKNVFLLGFIPAKTDTVVVLLCRQPCASVGSSKDMDWDLSQWQPLIDDKQFLQWFVKTPTQKDVQVSRRVSVLQIDKLEDLWREGKLNATLDDLDRPGLDDDIRSVQLQYDNAYQYQSIFTPLVLLEAEYDKMVKETQTQNDVTVRWEQAMNMKWIAYFYSSKLLENEIRINIGEELRLQYHGGLCRPWSCVGIVVKLPNSVSNEIGLEIKRPDVNIQCSEFSTEVVWNSTSFDRMINSLNTFALDSKCVSSYIHKKILGQPVENQTLNVKLPKRISVPGLADLNNSQAHAIKSALQRPISLIQGPPGTGKTVTAATLVYHLKRNTSGQVLVCAPSNVAVDQLAEKIHRTGLKVVRLTAKTREFIASEADFLSLHGQVRSFEGNPELSKLLKLKDSQGQLSKKDEEKFRKLNRGVEQQFLRHADVICCTCVGAGDPRLKNFKFKTVLIDEAAQATECEAMIPIVLGCNQLILVGDHQQLGPIVMSKKAAKAGLQKSLFERFVELGIKPLRLQVQYRMHPCLSEFPSNQFYDGYLQNGITAQERIKHELNFPWPDKEMPMFFQLNIGQEEMSPSGTSFLNRSEALNVEKVITKFLKSGVKPQNIGVITPYEGQRAFIVQYMKMSGSMSKELYEQIEVASVDSFQGREKDYIIFSCVRSNSHQGIGFLHDPRRLNVAITRAKFGLVIVGNPKVLARNELWHSLLRHYKEKKALVEGPLYNLRQSPVQLPAPRKPDEKAKESSKINSQTQKDKVYDFVNLQSFIQDGLYMGSEYQVDNYSKDFPHLSPVANLTNNVPNNNSNQQSQVQFQSTRNVIDNLSFGTNIQSGSNKQDSMADAYDSQHNKMSGFTEY